MPEMTFRNLRDTFGAETYHVTVIWPEGEVLSAECGTDRDGAFDIAAERHDDGCGVEVICIHRSPMTGGAIGVTDVTQSFFGERGIDAERTVLCDDCHVSPCRCDDAFEEWRDLNQVAAE